MTIITLEKMQSYNLVIQAVLERELYTTPPLMPVIVAKLIGTKKDIPRAFRVTKDLSTVDLKHLRRIRDVSENTMECIICKVHSTDKSDIDSDIKQLEELFSKENIFCDYRIAHVPSSAPKTDHQLRACGAIWPCKFAKSNYLIQCIEGSVFNESERLVLKTIVNCVLEHMRNDSCSRSMAVVFRCAKVYGIGSTNSTTIAQNPTKHSTMLCIDSVATNSGAGHWKCSTCEPLAETIQTKLDAQDGLQDHRIDAHFLPYLCTNYDIFVTEEPCFLCTMGLVQSRIRRLFYLDKGSLERLTTCQQLCYPDKAIEEFLVHRERNLNHRFEAWKITLVPEDD